MPRTMSAAVGMVLLAAACAPSIHPTYPPHPLVGAWRLAADAPATAQPGLQITLRVDSGEIRAFRGHVAFFFSGDVGVDPAMFRPFMGTLSEDGFVDLPVFPATANAPPLHFSGHFAGDTVRLERFTIGRDTVTTARARWFLIREARR